MEADARGQKMDGQLGKAGILSKNKADTVVSPIVVMRPKLLTNRQFKHKFLTRDPSGGFKAVAEDGFTATSAIAPETTAEARADESALCTFDRCLETRPKLDFWEEFRSGTPRFSVITSWYLHGSMS